MNPRTRSRMPASIGSNQASPENGSMPSACFVVLSCSMAWSPPALERRSGSLQRTGDYAATRFHHFRDGTHKPLKEDTWQREGHNLTLVLQAGVDRNRKSIGLPYGSYARFILLFLQSE